MGKRKYALIRFGGKTEKEAIINLSPQFLDFAILSSNIYYNSDDDPALIELKNWECHSSDSLPGIPKPKFKTQIKIGGLKYQVWKKETEGNVTIAIVFKGTTFTFLNDWICNLRWITMNPILKHLFNFLLWDYYQQVQILTPLIIQKMTNDLQSKKNLEFISTGHSLGGGLAQQAAYSTDKIKKVFAFDPSPVTGYKDVLRQTRLQNQIGIQTSRIYHKGEVLAYLRDFIRVYIMPLSTENPCIKEYEFSFKKGSAIKKHNMRDFAEYLKSMSI